MNPQQATFNFGPLPIHRYQVLDELFEEEERIASLPCKLQAPVSQAACRLASERLLLLGGAYQAPSGNPYSKIEDSPDLQKAMPATEYQEGVSVRTFQNEVRRILKQYSPTAGLARRLRTEFREFIASAVQKSSQRRAQILEELRKYDLEADGLAPPLFNREISRQLRKKLQELDHDSEDGSK